MQDELEQEVLGRTNHLYRFQLQGQKVSYARYQQKQATEWAEAISELPRVTIQKIKLSSAVLQLCTYMVTQVDGVHFESVNYQCCTYCKCEHQMGYSRVRRGTNQQSTRQRSWWRHYATSRKVMGLSPDEVTGFFSIYLTLAAAV
jgi:hypothetical protein